ncbi:NUDIX hydrolase [Nonomuraea rhizosphaerae]|uniref:NUDIX hydrolase n=1 Tax=Nonomuraea rhizosphaerae TaxID=2665663 RepID=UPI001C6065F1|nr:NUDIX hydrolase [Nonomuraea rhizosphaerae]
MTDPLRAAGAVVWRGDERRPEVAVIHRPAYDDWTFPKGKLKHGEHVIEAGLREVREETGMGIVLGRALPPVHYLAKGRLKRVDYWAARATDDGADFVPGDEVDEMRWLPIDLARQVLTWEWDAGLLRALVAAPLSTTPLVLVRHGHAGSRQEWKGDDSRRPLDDVGRAQAATVARVLPAYRPEVLLSSPSRRCVQTLQPYASGVKADIKLEPLLSEEGQDWHKTPTLVRELRTAAAVCSHGKVLPELIGTLSGKDVHLRKGAFAVLHRLGDQVVSVERYPT